ncbi:unnamed protein product [Cuscuta europaea]|uniref:Uncharacterized protein n=1 Tax=Cuscuta europaea TaxID=41803 RepID=A0A9P1EK97_CUSEU|nr:unnamed protein product [Cuscuta europaea]
MKDFGDIHFVLGLQNRHTSQDGELLTDATGYRNILGHCGLWFMALVQS